MELLSAPLHTGSVPWQRLLLTVSLVTYWSSPTTSQVHIEFVPPHVAEGKNILLCVSNLPENLLSILWYKGESSLINTEIVRYVITTNVNKTGPAYSGRETIFPNGSLLIQNVNLNDTGFYTLQTQNAEGDRIDTSIQLHVYRPVTQPSVHVTNSTVPEKGSVVFSCRSNDTGISIQWIFNNQNVKLSERMTLSENNSRLSIEPVMGEDTGDYQCEVSNPVSSEKSAPVRLAVNTAPDSGLPAGAIVGIVVGVVAGVALIAALVYFLCSRKTGRTSVQHDLRQPKPPVSTAGPGSPDIYVPAPFSTPKEATPVYQELLQSSRNIYDQINHRGDGTS